MKVSLDWQFDAPVDVVYRVFSEPRLMVQWLGGAERLEPVDDGPPAVGHRFRVHGREIGMNYTVEGTVTALEPDRRVAFTLAEKRFDQFMTFALTPDANGCRVVASLRIEVKRGGRVIQYLVDKMTPRQFAAQEPAVRAVVAAEKRRAG